MSDFSCPIVRITDVKKHENADSLSITEAEGCPVIFRTEDFKEGDLAIYVPIESVIPEGREWVKKHAAHLKFKNGAHRLRAVRLRKVFSMGMLVPVDALQDSDYKFKNNPVVGEDVMEDLGILKYEEPEDEVPEPRQAKPKTRWGRFVAWVRHVLHIKRKVKLRLMPVYEVSHYRKSKHVLTPGEEVVYTEKIHGCNAAVCLHEGKLYVSSHRVLRREEDDSLWWRAARQYELAVKLRTSPDGLPGLSHLSRGEKPINSFSELAFYGEVYGPGVQDMTYDVPAGEIRMRWFDIYDLKDKYFLPYGEARQIFLQLGLEPVPEVYCGPYDPATVESFADGKSTIASHFREGIVIRPIGERRDPRCGRVVLKLVGQEYLLRRDGSEKH